MDSMAPDQPPTTSAWSEEKEKKLKWLEKEVARLRKLNDGLQQALSAKVLDAGETLIGRSYVIIAFLKFFY